MARSEIVTLARQILAREIDPIDGCRAIVERQAALSLRERRDPGFRILLAIDAETDHLPTVSTRSKWSVLALREKDRQRAEYLERHELALRDACKSLLERLS